jgi:hypothetical protein
MAHVESNAAMRSCIDECQSCHEVCVETITHCLSMGGKHAEAEHIRTLMDCAQICTTSADFMLRGSSSHSDICDACADICDDCADSCEALDGAEMKRCADQCRRCAESCREMAKMPHPARST